LARRLFITSPSNARLKAVRRLGHSRSAGLILVEGGRAIRSALAGAVAVRELYVAPELCLGAEDAQLVAEAERRGARVVEVGAGAFRTLSRHRRPDGLLALADRPPTALARLALPAAPFVVVADGIERPGNLGTIARTACAAGADALVVADPCTDAFHPDVVRGSVGTVFRLPLAVTTSERAIAWLREREIRIVATTPAGSTPHRNATYAGRVGVVLGGERYGLSETWLEAADEQVAIPMPGPADSLNVAVAAGVVLIEAAAGRVGRDPG
jgi:RNA methyltransferase, TrmH family